MTDLSQLTVSGALVDQVNDQSGNNLHWTATGSERPTFTTGAMNTVADGVVFDGANTVMSGVGMGSGAERLTMAAAVFSSGPDGTSQIIMSDDSDNNLNLFVLNNALRAYGGDVSLSETNVDTEVHTLIAGVNTLADTLAIYGKSGATNTGTTIRNPLTDDMRLGAFGVGANAFDGVIGCTMLFDEDVQANAVLRTLIADYFTARFRL